MREISIAMFWQIKSDIFIYFKTPWLKQSLLMPAHILLCSEWAQLYANLNVSATGMYKITQKVALKSQNKENFWTKCHCRVIIILKVNYDYHKNYLRILWGNFFQKLYNFDNFIHRRTSDHKKITFAIKYLLMSHLGWWRRQSRDHCWIRVFVPVTRFH